MRMRRIDICGLSGSTAIFHILINSTIFGGKKKLLNVKCVFFNFLYNFFFNNFLV